MRLTSLILILLIGMVACKNNVPHGYDFTPVLLHLDKYDQHDSLGFNLATAIPKLLYAKILSEDIALWGSPDKQVKIDKTSFLEMEANAKEPFVESQHFFIHEVWQLFNRDFTFGVLGFSFTGERKKGGKINYGYVDAADVIVLMKERNIPNNANGTHYLSYWDALHSMQFDFNIVQFGKEDFRSNPIKSFQLKEQALNKPRIRRDFYEIRLDKEIEYRILHPAIISNPENALVYSTFERFINSNKQTILNAGGDKYFSHLINEKLKIDQIVVTEKWSRYNNIPFQELLAVQLFIDKKPITLNKRQLEELNVKINLQGLEEYLSGKAFAFTLQRINSQEIPAVESEKYFAALFNNDWNKLKK